MAGNAVADQSLIGSGAPVGTVPVGILTTLLYMVATNFNWVQTVLEIQLKLVSHQ